MLHRAIALLAALFIWPTGSHAFAHEETAIEAVTVLNDVTPEIAGVSFRVAHLTQPVLVATNRTDRPLVIFGRNDEPFLRIHDGRIETNANSPLSYSSRSPSGAQVIVPDSVDPFGRALWRPITRGRSWSWFDPRIRLPSAGSSEWSIVAGLGRRKMLVEGGFESFDTHGHFDTYLEGEAFVPGVDIRLTDGIVPAFFVRNDTERVLHVAGRAGEPFLRIGPRGVTANLESPDYYLGGAQTVRPVPKSVHPANEPRWRKLSTVPVWSWLEFRARLPRSADLRSNLGTERRPILRWTTPMSLGRARLTLEGVVEWIPPPAPSPASSGELGARWRWIVAGGVLFAIGLLIRWRKQDADPTTASSLGPP